MLPFALFYWMLPFYSDQVIGNDYPRFSIDHQLELLFSLKKGSFPLFVPGFAGGQTSSALTLGQLFHPLPHLSSLFPGYWNGKALEWNTFLRLVSLGLAHVSLFAFLWQIRLNKIFAFVLSAITVFNLRTLDMFRYGASLESYTGYLFLCTAIGFYCLKPSKFIGPLSILASTYWLVCSGHPQMMYYGLLGAIIFTLLIPFFLSEMLPTEKRSTEKIIIFWLKTACWCSVGILLSSAHIFPFYFDFISSNAGRVAKSYAWANMYLDTIMGTLNNFFQPLHSNVSGVFGGSFLFLIGALAPMVRLFRVKIPLIIWVIWIIIVLTFLHMQGSRLPIHHLFWKYFPFASSFRDPGRISMIMPLSFMLILSWVISTEPFSFVIYNKKGSISPISMLSIIALLFMCIYYFLPNSITSDCYIYSASSIRNIPPSVYRLTFIIGVFGFIFTLFYGFLPQFRFNICAIIAIITVIQIICFFAIPQKSL